LNSEKPWKIQKKSKWNSEKIWKIKKKVVNKGTWVSSRFLIQPTISLEMPVPSEGHYGFQVS
jgi:hypothetical protein